MSPKPKKKVPCKARQSSCSRSQKTTKAESRFLGIDGRRPEQPHLAKHNADQLLYNCKKLKKQGNPIPLKVYNSCKNDRERKKIGLSMRIDQDGAFCEVEEENKAVDATEVGKKDGWYRLWEVDIHAHENGRRTHLGHLPCLRAPPLWFIPLESSNMGCFVNTWI